MSKSLSAFDLMKNSHKIFLRLCLGTALAGFHNIWVKLKLTITDNISGHLTVVPNECYTPSIEKRRFLYFNHLFKSFLEQMIPHLKALI